MADIVDEAWAQKFLTAAWERAYPELQAAFDAKGLDDKGLFKNCVTKHVTANVLPFMAPYIQNGLNAAFADILAQAAVVRGERQVVIAKDANGGIREMVKVPLYAQVNVIPSPQ